MSGKNGSTQGNKRAKNPNFVAVEFAQDFQAGIGRSYDFYLNQVAPSDRATLLGKLEQLDEKYAEVYENNHKQPTFRMSAESLRDLPKMPKNFRNVHQRNHA